MKVLLLLCQWLMYLTLFWGCGSSGSGEAAPPSTVGTKRTPGNGASGTADNAAAAADSAPNAAERSAAISPGAVPPAAMPPAANAGQGGAASGASAMEGTGNVTALNPVTGAAGPSDPAAQGPAAESPPQPPARGAAAADVCPRGVAFGNPLVAMGSVQNVTAPAGSSFAFLEGPVWVARLNRLFFSDNASLPQERIWQIDPPFTTPSIFLENSGSNGIALDHDDQLLIADQRNHRITRVDPEVAQVGEVLAPAGAYTPNDLIARSDGNVYFTDPNSNGRGLYRMSAAGQLSGPFRPGTVSSVPNSPNGVVLSPDENTLYVGDVGQQFVASFRLQGDGALDTGSGQVFVRTRTGTVDGMAVDCAGNLYVGTNNGVEVYAPDATFIGTVPTGQTSSNATFGGVDRRTLFVTQGSTLKYITLAVPGLPD